jgi:hypothetical protein
VKWQEVNLAAVLPGWTRFEGAQAWLDNYRQDPSFVKSGPTALLPVRCKGVPPAAGGGTGAAMAHC